MYHELRETLIGFYFLNNIVQNFGNFVINNFIIKSLLIHSVHWIEYLSPWTEIILHQI